jgi:hypothetical protein
MINVDREHLRYDQRHALLRDRFLAAMPALRVEGKNGSPRGLGVKRRRGLPA